MPDEGGLDGLLRAFERDIEAVLAADGGQRRGASDLVARVLRRRRRRRYALAVGGVFVLVVPVVKIVVEALRPGPDPAVRNRSPRNARGWGRDDGRGCSAT